MTGWWRWLSARPAALFDVLLWAVLSAPIAWGLLAPPPPPWHLPRLVASLLLMAAATVASRRQPLVSLLLVVAPTLIDGNFAFAIPVMSYLVGLRMAKARPAALVFGAITLGGLALNIGLLDTDVATWFLLITTLLFAGVFPWLVGRYRRQHRELIHAGWEQAELLEREQRGVAERVRMRERARIAQDMHDSLGHELSLLALRAGALEMAPDLADRHRLAAGELRASVGAATERLREIIGVLREDAEPAPTQPAGESINDLVERAREAGMSVRLRRDEPDPAPSPMLARAAYRVVQEALTNATRHAPGAAVTVRLSRSGERTVVSVINDAPPAGPLPGASSAGSGLLGLRERVRLAGGSLHAGPRAGGFEVIARLPRAAGTAVPGPGAGAETVRPAGSGLRAARQRVRRSLLVAVIAPVAIAAPLSTAYYSFVTFNATLGQRDFDQLRVGQQRADLVELLPARQPRLFSTPALPAPADATCEFYTDGNFPFGLPTYRLCFADGRLVSKDRLPD